MSRKVIVTLFPPSRLLLHFLLLFQSLSVIGAFNLSDFDNFIKKSNNDGVGGQKKKFSLPTKDSEILSLCRSFEDNEYFRLEGHRNCKTVYRCDSSVEAIRISPLTCSESLYFDIELQTCQWRNRVNNCQQLSKGRIPKPLLNSTECLEDSLQCGSTECVKKINFCDGVTDCQDGSDENICSLDEDPNAVGVCDESLCQIPECFCTPDGTKAPHRLSREHIPQMITLSFNGPVTKEAAQMYNDIFSSERLNPNGCSIKGTFFVSHKFTDYFSVERLYRKGNEIGVFSITRKNDMHYWSHPTYSNWSNEMIGAKSILENMANVSSEDIVSVRVPYLLTGGNVQFEVMKDHGLIYDSTITAPYGTLPIWPYSLRFQVSHKCTGSGKCPSRSYDIWELPINELDRRENSHLGASLSGCSLISSCSNIRNKKQFKHLLEHNFERHYFSNRAPLSLSFDPSWFQSSPELLNVLMTWIDDVLLHHEDVYFVTGTQVIKWMKNPVSLDDLPFLEDWNVKCTGDEESSCLAPNPCELRSEELPGEVHRLLTCMPCPPNYPWINDPTGDGLDF